MSFWRKHRYPVREDYESEDEFKDAMSAYEDAEYWAIEQAEERMRETN